MLKDFYKIAFCGLGSIGKRHLKNTVQYLKERGIGYEIDWIQSSPRAAEDEIKDYISNSYLYSDNIPDDYDIVFITNPTSEHFDTIKLFADKAKNMFIEKPIFDTTDKDINELSLKTDGVYYVACPLRYTNVLRYVKENVDYKSAYSVRAVCSSYLPDWRPGTDYRKTYSASKAMGGGVSIDLIHEWDYLCDLFGKPDRVLNVRGKYSHLEIDSDDLSVYIGVYKDRLIELHLDYFGRKGVRKLELFMPEDTVVADLNGGTVSYLKEGRVIDLSEERNDFQKREIEHFFDIVSGEIKSDNTVSHALDCLRVASED